MDIEGTTQKPLEIAVVKASDGKVINYFHAIIFQEVRNKTDNVAAAICHGIPQWPGNSAISKETALKKMRQYLEAVAASEIVVHGTDCQELLTKNKPPVVQAELFNWDLRPYHFSHQAAQLFKLNKISLKWGMYCPAQNHRMYRGKKRPANTINQANKKKHGYHCALADAVELMLWHSAGAATK